MFKALREARSLLMGLAIIAVAIFHAPFRFPQRSLQLIHDSLYCGVDVFVFLSGLGACHSLARRGGRDYLLQRAQRMFPGLMPFLILWSLVMTFYVGVMDLWDLFGSVTLLGWWLGEEKQLNWYFSGIWLMFLLAAPAYRLFRRTGRPFGLWALLVILSMAFGLLWPFDHHRILFSRLPIFFTGMLFGVLEQREFQGEKILRKLCYALILPGIVMIVLANWTELYACGDRLGLWWYPFLLIVPGVCLLVAFLSQRLELHVLWTKLTRPIRLCGESSAEILMLHVGIFKFIQCTASISRKLWLLVLLGTLVLGCLYRSYVTPHLHFPARKAKSA